MGKNAHDDFWSQYEVQTEKGGSMTAVDKKAQRRERLQQKLADSTSFSLMQGTVTLMDKYYLDPILGLVPLVGLGDVFTSVFCLPSVYVALVKIKSIPLTLAILLNILIDSLIGLIPFWIGNICDFFNRSYIKNMRLVVGYVEGDEQIVKEVNNKAVVSAVLIVLVCIAIYYMVQLAIWAVNWVAGLFS